MYFGLEHIYCYQELWYDTPIVLHLCDFALAKDAIETAYIDCILSRNVSVQNVSLLWSRLDW